MGIQAFYIAGAIILLGGTSIWLFTLFVGTSFWSYWYSEFTTSLKSMMRVDRKNDRNEERRLIRERKKLAEKSAKAKNSGH